MNAAKRMALAAAFIVLSAFPLSRTAPAEFARAIEEQLTAFTAIAKSLDQRPRR